ncbi:hypothetical protein niasHT_038930 [Heterodera trifolii]|uniref:Uncharacterized protein n=1 Tax=Heterodera trifolii TaxID=157864 RepID=A0ABD2J411_9BILA
MLLMCTICQMSTDQTIHLTDGGGGFKEVQLHTLAQCHANNGSKQTANKLFGIEFRLPREDEICDDGILICYPAMLQRGNHLDTNRNSKFIRKFLVGANMGNSVAEECVQKMAKHGNKNGTKIWRGLKLRTVPKQNDQNNERIIILESSIASKKQYNLSAGQRKFSVLFALNQITGPFTHFSLEENDFDGRAMQNDFLHSNGPSFLADYSDLWLLGIDILPMAHQTEEQREQLKMKLFIHRSSNCSMEAWFVQPDPKMPFDGSACKPNPTEEEYERLFPKKVDKYVFTTGGGCAGLGNQMFRFAALYGIGKPYGRKPIYKDSQKCNKSHVNAVEKGEKKEQLFPIFASQEKYFGQGCLQSYKFFESRKTEIRQIFQFGHQLCLNVTAFKKEFFGNDQSHKFCVHTRRGDIVKDGWGSRKEPTEKGIDFGFEHLKEKFNNISISVVLLGADKQFLEHLTFKRQANN